jgi:hypothetical protein
VLAVRLVSKVAFGRIFRYTHGVQYTRPFRVERALAKRPHGSHGETERGYKADVWEVMTLDLQAVSHRFNKRGLRC